MTEPTLLARLHAELLHQAAVHDSNGNGNSISGVALQSTMERNPLQAFTTYSKGHEYGNKPDKQMNFDHN